ncbi:MAG: Type 1 glutamine amidotransferase-like domain-containing protein, partial [Planctomycetales bacterium]
TIIASNALENATDADALFLRASGGKDAVLLGLFWGSADDDRLEGLRTTFKDAASIELAVADPKTNQVPAETLDKLKDVSGVMLFASDPLPDGVRRHIVALREKLLDVLRRGGAIHAVGAATKLLSRVEITGGRRLATAAEGLGLIPDSVIETQFANADDAARLRSVLVSHPRTVGIGLEKNSAVVLAGRKLRVLGQGRATVMITANERQSFRAQRIAAQKASRQRPHEYLIDWTQWRRQAIDRALKPFPPARPETPLVENGTLVIVGGGGMPKGLMDRFVELAGGAVEARLVYVPCSERETLSDRQRTVEMWREMGVKHATFIHTKDRVQANSDQEFLKPLKDATGIWFGGGRQWNFADSYYGTKAHELMKDVARRGGVIGGSSAGASIQARYLARATPIENYDIMAPGYERGGLGFIGGVAIDQHFSQRGRQKDMTQLVNRYPQLLGVGLDEATAIIVRKSLAEVVGRGKAHFYDRNLPVFPDQPDFIALPAGSHYDLAARKIVKPEDDD